MDSIKEQQYENLREYFNHNLVNPILGKGYYNMGQCVYSCDRMTTEDLKNRFQKLERERDEYKVMFRIVSVIAVILGVINFI